MKLNSAQLGKHLQGTLAAIYVVSGDDPLLCQEAADAIRAATRSKGFSERQVFHCDATFDWNLLYEAGASLSLFAEQRLIELRDAYLNSIEGVASETIRNENGDSSAFGMHQADAGSDAYDRDFALSLLGKEQDALYEINEALKRIETGTYGLCEGTGVDIPEERLEAMPFARFSVTYQEKLERSQMSGRWSRPVHSLFGLDNADDASDDDKDDDDAAPSSSNNNSGESLDFSKE